jgi:hypothetical protein
VWLVMVDPFRSNMNGEPSRRSLEIWKPWNLVDAAPKKKAPVKAGANGGYLEVSVQPNRVVMSCM